MSDKGLKRLLVSAAVTISLGAFVGILIAGAGAASSWSCVVTGEHGGKHNFTVQANDQGSALQACKDAFVASATYKVTPNGTTTTTTTNPGNGYPSIPPPLAFDGDFDSGCQLVGGEGGWSQTEAGPGTISIVNSLVAEGNCAAKFSVPASTHGRAELQGLRYSPDPTLSWEQLLLVPSMANNGPRHGSVGQTKMDNNPCYNGGLVLSDKLSGDQLGFSVVPSCSAGSTHYSLGPVIRDQWFAVRVDEHFSGSGSLKVQIDPDGPGPAGYSVALDKPSIDTTPVSNAVVKLREGLYFNNHDPQEVHVYGDGFHVVGG